MHLFELSLLRTRIPRGHSIALLGGLAVSIPLTLHAQQSESEVESSTLPVTEVSSAPVIDDAYPRVHRAPRVRPATPSVEVPAAPAPSAATPTENALPLTSWSGLTPLAGQVTSVSERQIEELNAQDLASALRRTPGVVISRHNPIGAFGGGDGGAVFIRGLGASRPGAEIQTSMDGIPRFVGVWTHPILDTLSIDNVQRIDVYKGAQPVLYGNMALGVVDLVTKRRTEPGSETEFNTAYGSYDSFMQSFEHGAKQGPLDFYFVQSYRESDGHRPFASGRLENYLFRVGYELSPHWSANLLYHHTDNTAADPGDIRTGIREGRFDTRSDFGVLTFANQYENSEGYVKLYWDSGGIDWVDQFNPMTGRNENDTLTDWDNYGIRVRQTFHPVDGAELMVGHDLDYISGEVLFRSPGPDRVFPRETYRLSQPYFLYSHRFDLAEDVWIKPSFGARGFFHSVFDDEIGPQAGVVLNIDRTQFHFGYARGLNYPGVFVDTLGNTFQPGNNRQDELSAEIVEHFEYGISHDFNENLTVEVVGFVDQGRDRIAFTPPPPFPPVWENLGNFETRGVEATGTWRAGPGLTLYAGATWLTADPDTLPYTPGTTASFGVSWRFLEDFLLSVDGSYVADQLALTRGRLGPPRSEPIDSYFLLGARLAYQFETPVIGGLGEAYVAGENLTDAAYQFKPGYPMPGANAMVGLKLSF